MVGFMFVGFQITLSFGSWCEVVDMTVGLAIVAHVALNIEMGVVYYVAFNQEG